MKILPKEFTKSKFSFLQIFREGNVAIYSRSGEGHKYSHFEVVRVKSHDGYKIADTIVLPSEFYPKSEAWGIDGFTFFHSEQEKAFDKAKELLNEPIP